MVKRFLIEGFGIERLNNCNLLILNLFIVFKKVR